jgi:hypothetical protein
MATRRPDETHGRIEFGHLGIGEVLNRGRYIVPVNQREYSWEEKHIKALWSDFTNALGKSSYFLGTIVLTGGIEGIPEIADGQQRLATTTIILAAIRDWFLLNNEVDDARSIENDFLQTYDRDVRGHEPRLRLNVQDNEFFRRRILSHPGTPDRQVQVTSGSHKRIAEAAQHFKQRIENAVSGLSKEHKIAHLNNWVKFLDKTAQVIVLTVPDDLDAFVMFETLNDRGLKTSQADLLKNYLFQEASAGRLDEAQQKWATMMGALETLEEDDITLSYLRTLESALYGLTRARDVFIQVKDKVSGKNQAVTFLDTLAEYSNEYVAILNPDSSKWNAYSPSIRQHIRTINTLGVQQIRPLMLAVAKRFPPREAEKAFRLFVGWSVRFLIAGGGRGGTLEDAYAERAKEVSEGEIITAKKLASEMLSVVPSDVQFGSAFASATVSKSHLARYYLRALEMKIKGEPEPELVPNEDTVINLEHVMPVNPKKGWEHIPADDATLNYRRIGNMVLLQASKNNELGNKPFPEKRPTLKASPYLLTKMVGQKSSWDIADIDERQWKLAKLAVETWSATL